MMRFQCRSLLAFFMMISASLAKEKSVAEYVTTSRHKGRSHKVSASNLEIASEATDEQIQDLAAAKFNIMDSPNGINGAGVKDGFLTVDELLENYDDVNAFQSTSTDQNKIFHSAMDRDGDGKINNAEHEPFEVTMLTDYDDTFDAVATKKVEFLKLFDSLDTNPKDYHLTLDECGGDSFATAFAKADVNSDTSLSFEEFIEDDKAADGNWLLWDLLNAKVGVSWSGFNAGGLSWNLFNELDRNHDGSVERLELEPLWECTVFPDSPDHRICPDREIEKDEWEEAQNQGVIPQGLLMKYVDGDSDGDVDREEFMTLATNVAVELFDEFRNCDKDKEENPRLSKAEITACTGTGKQLPAMSDSFFALLDGDSNGFLDYAEFMTCCTEISSVQYFSQTWVYPNKPFGEPHGNTLTKGVEFSD